VSGSTKFDRVMAGPQPRTTPAGIRARRRTTKPSFELSESKLHPPLARPGIVSRDDLVARLANEGGPPVISVVAPPGYGKTTLLAQWAEHRRTRVAWVSLDDRDNDPTVLMTYIAVALDRVEPLAPSVFRALAVPGMGGAAVPRLMAAIASMTEPIGLVLDQAEVVINPQCLDVVTALALGLPPGSQLAVSSRHRLPLPLARLRAQGGIHEVGVTDLAMGRRYARSLFDGAGLKVTEAELTDVLGRTEGWPAGLYLAALAMNAGSRERRLGACFTGDDRFMGDYLRSEFLDRVSRADVRFLTRTSVLDRLSGPLCDAVLDSRGSARTLAHLENRNLLVVPLDHRRQWYRYHQLFRELLHAELVQREPEMVARLHSRAAAWFESNGMPETAIEHAQAGGDADRVARLVLNVMQPVWASGRVETVQRWMQWLDGMVDVAHYGAIAAHGSLIMALLGRTADAERWAAAAERSPSAGILPDGNTVEATLAYLRALLCRDGVASMRDDARMALAGLGPGSPYRATMLHTEAVAYLLEEDPDRADRIFAHAADVATSTGALPLAAVILANRGMIATGRGDWVEAERFASEALSIVDAGQFDEYWTSALVFSWGARVMLHGGHVARGQDYVVRAARLRPLLTYALPVGSVQALLELAHAYVALGDAAGARTVLRQVHDIHQQRPDLGVLPKQAAALRARLDTITPGSIGASSLTAAELRLLPMLATHLTIPEIAKRLFVSRHTVKSQVIAIYRKFGVNSRAEAIARMHELGLLSHS